MTSLLTDSYLSDFHIDYALTKIFHQHNDPDRINIPSHHAFLSVSDLTTIATGYKANKCGYHTYKRQQLLDIENKIISGNLESVAGVLHLPNHWTSLVILFKPPKIIYGDSLGSSILPKIASAFRRWVCHMLDRSGREMSELDISVYPLQTTNQQDPNSCGLFALNAICCHYLPQTSSLLQPDVCSVACYRLELALDHLQDGAVS